jgi:hypothetical protein
MASLSFTAFLNDDPIRFMVGHHCDYVRVIKELKTGIVLAIRPGTLSSERLTVLKGKAAEFNVVSGHPVIVTYKQRKGKGYQLVFDATMHVKISRPGFIGIE